MILIRIHMSTINRKKEKVDYPKRVDIVTVFLEYKGKILILRRSKKVRTMQCKWAGISGYIENTNSPLKQALIEIREETGLSNEKIKFVRSSPPLEATGIDSPNILWIVHPYLFHTYTNQIKIDWEHDEYKWITPSEIPNYECVPKLKDALGCVYLMDTI